MTHSTEKSQRTQEASQVQDLRITRTPERVKWLSERRQQQVALVKRRRELVAPLFTYCQEYALRIDVIARRAAEHAGSWEMTRSRLARIKRGRGIIPDWFIPGICREIGQPVETVMGSEWAQRHLPQPTQGDTTDHGADQDTDRKAS